MYANSSLSAINIMKVLLITKVVYFISQLSAVTSFRPVIILTQRHWPTDDTLFAKNGKYLKELFSDTIWTLFYVYNNRIFLNQGCIVLYCGRVPGAPRCSAAEGLLYKPWSLVVPTCTVRCLHQRS